VTTLLQCYICGNDNFIKRKGKVRDNTALEILECPSCGLVFLSSFDHITDDFYKNSGMHSESSSIDIDAWIKETSFDDNRRLITYSEIIAKKDILDFGCGTGEFLRLARNCANNVYGIEQEKRLYSYYQENKLLVYDDISNFDKTVDYIFLFHVLEHIKDPIAILNSLKSKLKHGGKIIVEVPNADDALLTLYKSEAFSNFTYWSPHLYLFNANTLPILAKKAGLNVICIKQMQRYPFSNHLHWLSKGKPGGHIVWNFLNNHDMAQSYESTLAALGKCDTIVGYFEDSDHNLRR
jgi:2-polyprenyl-3-methyl-5-hydroxy-6-metoxy-1,4-benzoquinol methylase